MNSLFYKGFEGAAEFDAKAEVFYGRIINISDIVDFQADNVKDLKQAFIDSVEDYLEFCKELGKEPNKPTSGKFVVRTAPEVHAAAIAAARKAGLSLNKWVSETIRRAAML